METNILVRSSEREWDLTLAILGGVIAASAGFLLDHNRWWLASVSLMTAGALVVVGAIFMRRRRRALRRWVRDADDGFVVIDRDGEAAYSDDEVASVAIRLKRNYQSGELKSLTRRFLAWPEGASDTEPIEMVNVIKSGEADPLGDLINRLNNRLVARAEEQLDAGRPVTREGWTLTNQSLRFERKQSSLEARLDEVVAVDTIDDQLCLWRKGDDAAWARLPMNAPDAYLLGQIVSNRIAKRPQTEEAPTGDGLGRVIFERRVAKSSIAVRIVIAVLSFIAALLFLVVTLTAKQDGFMFFAIFTIFFLVASGALASAIDAMKGSFRCHQFGVFKSNLFGQKTLRYADMEAFTYSAVRHFHNGVYTGTHFMLRFEPLLDRKRNAVKYTATLRNVDEELDHLRDVVSRIIAGRLRERLAAGDEVPWLSSATFTPSGLVTRPPGFLKRKDAILVPYAAIDMYRFEDGTFKLFQKDDKSPILQATASDWNFFPGFCLMLDVVGSAIAATDSAKNAEP